MLTFSHVQVGKMLCAFLEERHGLLLRRSSFLRGGVAPDFVPSFKKMPHEPIFWESYLKSEVKWLSSQPPDGPRSLREYSYRLGVVCHFYADFFCRPHAAGDFPSTARHLKYEWDLYRYMRKNALSLSLKSSVLCAQAAAATSSIAGLEDLLREYLSLEPSFDADAVFALRACARLLDSTVCRLAAEPFAFGGIEARRAET